MQVSIGCGSYPAVTDDDGLDASRLISFGLAFVHDGPLTTASVPASQILSRESHFNHLRRR